MRIVSGIQPTGSIHLGNYLGAIKQWVGLQHKDETLLFIADLHALTTGYPDPEALAKHTRLVAACYIASGIDPSKVAIFAQSDVPEHTELAWFLGCLTPLGWLNRMTQFKDKAGKHKEQASLGLYGYPVLMAADVLVYKATHVPVGADQKQHLELMRDIAGAFNRQVNHEIFPLPEPCILGPATRVMSLRDGTVKMSKSDHSELARIHIFDDSDAIAAKIRKAKTDSEPLPATEEGLIGREEARNLVTILAAITDQPVTQILKWLGGESFARLKNELTEALIAHFTPIRYEIEKLMEDPTHLNDILVKSAEKARNIAQITLKEVRRRVGVAL